MKRVPKLLLLLILFSAVIAYADTPQTRILKARELVSLLRYDENIENSRNSCRAQAKTVRAEEKVAEEPGYFGGITPQSVYWSEIKAVYESYFEVGCQYLDKPRILQALEEKFANSLSEKELDEVLVFHRTQTSKKFQEATIAVRRELNDLVSGGFIEQRKEAERQYRKKFNDIVTKYRRDPK